MAKTPARKLADWTRLSATRFGEEYARALGSAAAPSWNMIVAEVGRDGSTESAPIRLACRASETGRFLGRLCLMVSEVEAKQGRPARDVAAIRAQLGGLALAELAEEARGPSDIGSSDPRMELMTDRARGHSDGDMLYDLVRVLEASAQVEEGGRVIGTAFLVAPDLVMTAAHVALQYDDTQFLGELKELTIVFRPPRGAGLAAARRLCLDPESALVAWSLPDGTPPNRLNADLTVEAERRLDYALLRLPAQVSDVTPLSVAEPQAFVKDVLCFVIGYPGAPRPVFDADKIATVPAVGARAWHMVNALPGMSGSCCIANAVGIVGIHEGGSRNGEVVRNRAISLQAIRRDIRLRFTPDPLVARSSAPGFAIWEPAVIDAWRIRTAQLAADGLEAWTERVETALHDWRSPYHPWFSRDRIERWIDMARRSDDDHSARILFVGGERGVGKSFCLDILAAIVPHADVVRLAATEVTRWSWKEAISRLVTLETSLLSTRTAAGTLKYETVEAVISRLQRWGSADREASKQPLFVAVDCEAGGDFGLADPDWRQFLLQCAARPWIRLMLTGLSQDAQDELEQHLSNLEGVPAPDREDLAHVGSRELERFIRALTEQDGQVFDIPRRRAVNELWKASKSFLETAPQLTTAEAVRLALAEVRRIKTRGSS